MASRTHIRIGTRNAELLENADFSEWDDQELIEGRRKDRHGQFRGRPPKVIPAALLHELNRRIAPEVHRTLLSGAIDAAEYLRAVAAGEVEPDANRTHVCNIILSRLFGTAPQTVEISMAPDKPSVWDRIGHTVVIRERPKAIEANSKEADS